MTLPIAKESGTVSMEIRVRGTVQGVGFRPMVWLLARECGLAGTVCNDGSGVLINVSGPLPLVSNFLDRLKPNAPPLSLIDHIESTVIKRDNNWQDFRIIRSAGGEIRTQVTPDAATCTACQSEILDPSERRYGYPFANCTHCGPRFSIVRTVPYDRVSTTMAAFKMCEKCQQEYKNPEDRRFHAQPIACHACGPKVWLERLGGEEVAFESDHSLDYIDATASLLKEGAIVAIRGLGGFHLACDATNAAAVERLRNRKRRFAKPFALMARDMAVIRRYCHVNAAEHSALTSAQAPIVVLDAQSAEKLPASVAPGVNSLGFMLPYTPLHHLLMKQNDKPLIMTSGNMSDEPQVTEIDDARDRLSSIADYALLHDRDIANRVDDSVVRFMAGKRCILRRARGYSPAAIPLPGGFEAAPDIVAYGGELKATFCLLKDGAAILAQHQGDLEDPAVLDDYQKNMSLYQNLYDHDATLLATDLHPEYLSTKLAIETSEIAGVPTVGIQHHHAHIASCMAENGVSLSDRPVLGVALDGLGMGDDGTLWGGEFMLADYLQYKRLATFKPVAMPGGVQAVREPWRNTYAHLVAAIGWSRFAKDHNATDLFRYLEAKPRAILDRMQAGGVNSPLASSCGRLFDAVAAAVGLCRDQVFYEGQGAIELETAAGKARCDKGDAGDYQFVLTNLEVNGLPNVEPAAMWQALLGDLNRRTPVSVIASRFHNGLARTIVDTVAALVAAEAKNGNQISTIALTGGCFQNKLLLEKVVGGMSESGLKIITHSRVPANDGGLSLGQAVIAAARHIQETGRQGRE
jgi:hydrogenase maturation protein HypF